MKKVFWIIIFIYLYYSLTPMGIVFASSNYARITKSNLLLLKTPAENTISNCYCELENSYFVQVLSVDNNYCKVSYCGIVGYVLTNDITKVYGVPITPYPENITFNINNSLNLKIRTSPKTSLGDTNVIGILPINANLQYIGKVEGEECINGFGNEWFYCVYNYDSIGKIVGYVYAPLTNNLTPIPLNTEVISDKAEESATIVPSVPDSSISGWIIAILCAPALIIVAVLVMPAKNKNTVMPNNVKVFKNKSDNKDYYEAE